MKALEGTETTGRVESVVVVGVGEGWDKVKAEEEGEEDEGKEGVGEGCVGEGEEGVGEDEGEWGRRARACG